MGLNIDAYDSIYIPIKTSVTKLIFGSRYPSEQELLDCSNIPLISKIECNPTIFSLS